MPCPIIRNKPSQTQHYNKLPTMCGNWTYLCSATDWTFGPSFKDMHEVTLSVTRSVTYPLSTWNSMTPTGPFFVRFYILDVHWNFLIKTGQSNIQCTWRPMYLYMIIAVFGLYDWDILCLLSGTHWGWRKVGCLNIGQHDLYAAVSIILIIINYKPNAKV